MPGITNRRKPNYTVIVPHRAVVHVLADSRENAILNALSELGLPLKASVGVFVTEATKVFEVLGTCSKCRATLFQECWHTTTRRGDLLCEACA